MGKCKPAGICWNLTILTDKRVVRIREANEYRPDSGPSDRIYSVNKYG